MSPPDPKGGQPSARAATPARGAEVELRVDGLAFGGAGVARHEGYVVFVAGALPGDLVRASITKRKRAYAEARIVELLEPARDRIEPREPHPGAPWQVLPYERQLEHKQRLVIEALERIGRFEDPPVAPIVPAVEQWRYRNKLEYSFGGASDGGELVLGFHRSGRWNEIDDVSSDILASESVDEVRESVKQWCRSEALSTWDRRDHHGFLRNLVVREGRRSGQVQARLITGPGQFNHDGFARTAGADAVLWTATPALAETTDAGTTRLLQGSREIDEELTVAGRRLRFRISPEAFFQTNTEMAEVLYTTAIETAGLDGSDRVFDLFCGIGTIALALASRAREVWGIEIVEAAVGDAIANAELNGITNVQFFAGDVRTAMRPLIERTGKPDVIVLDPPRAGLSQKIVRRVLEGGAERIVYVSCNPSTLAPNARQIVDAGYRLSAVTPVDMFPQTPHIEAVALLERSA